MNCKSCGKKIDGRSFQTGFCQNCATVIVTELRMHCPECGDPYDSQSAKGGLFGDIHLSCGHTLRARDGYWIIEKTEPSILSKVENSTSRVGSR